MNRKATLFVVAILCATAPVLNAQIRTYINAGLIQSNLKSDLFLQDQANLSYIAGLSFEVPISAHFSVHPSVSFTTKGASAQTTIFQTEKGTQLTSYKYSYQVFESTLQLGWKPNKKLPIQLLGGAYVDAMSNRLDNHNTMMVLGDLSKSHVGLPISTINESFSGMDYGTALGLTIGEKRFRFTVQYLKGLTNLYKYSNINATGHSIKTSTTTVTLAYRLK